MSDEGGEVRTDNDFLISNRAGQLVPILPVLITTRQQAYRMAAYLKLMGFLLADEPLASTYEEVEHAIANA